ncbi:tRNA preQ1(34) S-adenosylmethionine ribosyltransferase-isomerase QueA [Ghiorsea bivora]|uniref:tRNA preQ1(34) S-adenosylmethionine ribosyltransferase-isomerase QueA n=1 Tax=Ghiorsea bivora TaxID=1485545 RepID=UPI00056E3F54|nr:tRNA preQ1(34) S-adenosylmethionine ribosyltransferase-isomerase QueA [Ghiorsea bivora]
MQVSDFDFRLPENLIAKQPLTKRDASRLLVLAEDDFQDKHIPDLVGLVQQGDVWVVNDTKVIPARLMGKKESGGKVEVLLLEALGQSNIWSAWGKSNKPLSEGQNIYFSDTFSGQIIKRNGKNIEIKLIADDIGTAIEQHGHMPLPPYINRPDSEEDKQRYQTVFAQHKGAVAAPTAGLHLTPDLIHQMKSAGATFVHVTLHVGPGTFQPIQVENTNEHVMHEEAYIISDEAAKTINQAKSDNKRIVAVGTTSLRTLEAAGQSGQINAGADRTNIFITPSYQFKITDALLTNFHLPKSTLLMLVSALAGQARIKQAYQHAITQQYRFYSYGDAMFIPSSLPVR